MDNGTIHILHLNSHSERVGGVETYLQDLFPRLEEQGVRSSLAYSQGSGQLAERRHVLSGLDAYRFGAEATLVDQLTALLRETRPDIVHVHNVQSRAALSTALDYGPTVITSHDYRWVCPANTFFYKRGREVCRRAGAGLACFPTTLAKHCLTPRPGPASYFYRRSRWATQQADRLAAWIAPSRRAGERLLAAGIPASSLHVLPYFCPVPPSASPRPLPARRTITFLGRWAPNKGLEYFVEALGLLPKDVYGIMAGDFSERGLRQIEDMARHHGCHNRLALRPWAGRDEVLHILDQTTVLIFPSLWEETLGIVGLEAFARGVPVVASHLGGVTEWLEDGVTGILVPPKDAAAIRDGVEELTADPERLLAIGNQCIQTIREGFLPEQHLERLVGLYRRVLAF